MPAVGSFARRGLVVAAVGMAVACGGTDEPKSPEYSEWSLELPAAGESFGVRRGLVPARGVIHLHSPYSHDACDGEPRAEDGTRSSGPINEPCLLNLRDALCKTRVDFAALTDHDDSMAYEAFDTLFSLREDDVMLTTSASRMTCENGHQVTFSVGGENSVMPIMLDRHVPGTQDERALVYDSDSPESVAAFRDAGALVIISHAEQRPTAEAATLEPDGIEIYNLHANIDPDIRNDYLGLDKSGAILSAAEFADTSAEGPEPDLMALAFVLPNVPALTTWDALLGDGKRVFATTGTDAHENALPITLRDGERADSYRRMIRWATNIALVADPGDPAQIEAAVGAGRSFVAFELFGTPAGFDVVAVAGTQTAELGSDIDPSAGFTLKATLPTLHDADPALPAPEIRGRILRVDGTGTHEVATGVGPVLSAPVSAPGAYRVEVMITPHHHGPRLGRLGTAMADMEYVWIYSNPIYAWP